MFDTFECDSGKRGGTYEVRVLVGANGNFKKMQL